MGWKKAFSLIARQKRKKSKQKNSREPTDSQEPVKPSLIQKLPPSHEEVILNSNSNDNAVVIPPQCDNTLKYEQLHAALQNLKLKKTDVQAANILYTHPNVRIYFISRDGTVKATTESDTLNIMELQDGVERPAVYLQVGDWIYPLVPGVSACLKTEYGAFIMPDLHSPEEGATVGIILPEEANASVYELLNDILHATVEAPPSIPLKRASHKRPNKSFSVSQKMIKGAQFISHGMICGAEKAGRFMNNRTPKIMQRIEPQETPASINPKVESGLKVAKNVSQGAVTVTSYIVSRVEVASSTVGHYLAPRIHRKGTQLLSTTLNYSEQRASKKVDNAFLVAAGAVGGVATVFGGLINAAGILAQSLTTNTVKIVQHKYGEPAGAVAGETFLVAGNVFVAGVNIMHLNPHGLLEVAAEEMTLALVEDYRVLLEDSSENRHNKVEPSSKEDEPVSTFKKLK